MFIPLLLCALPAFALKSIHLGTGRVVQWDSSADPTKVERLRLSVTKTLADGANGPVKIHIVRLRWSIPHSWNDNGNEDERTFNIVCEAEDGAANESVPLIDISISADITAIHERYVFPDTPVSIICAVRAVNSNQRKGPWKYSKLILLGTDLMMKENDKKAETNKVVEDEKKTVAPINDSVDLKELLAMSTLEEIPFPKWEKRPAVSLNGTEITEPTESTETTTLSSDNSTTIELPEDVTMPLDQLPTKEIQSTIAPIEETTMTFEEMKKMLEESELKPIFSQSFEEALPKADQIIREPDLFLRGIDVKPSDLPEDGSHDNIQQILPFQTEVFDEVLRLSPGKLTPQEKEDYDLLEARLREAIGVPQFERAL